MCERRGAEAGRSGGVWWGTPDVNEASSPPLLYAERASPRETGLFHVHARWCPRGSLPRAFTLVSSWVQEGSIEGDHAARAAGPAVRTRSAPVIRPSGQDAGPTSPVERRGPRGRRSRWISHRPSHPDLSGERVRPPDSAPTWTLPSGTLPLLHKARSTTRAPDPPVYFGHFSPWTLLLYYFMSNKSLSEAWRHAHCVCRLLFPAHWWRMQQAEPRQRSWATADDVIPSRSQKSVKTRTGTEERRRQPPSHRRGKWLFVYGHLPCGWLRLSSKTRFLCPGSGAVREGELPGEELFILDFDRVDIFYNWYSLVFPERINLII